MTPRQARKQIAEAYARAGQPLPSDRPIPTTRELLARTAILAVVAFVIGCAMVRVLAIRWDGDDGGGGPGWDGDDLPSGVPPGTLYVPDTWEDTCKVA